MIHTDFVLTSIDWVIAAAAFYVPFLAFRHGRTAWRRSSIATMEIVDDRTIILEAPTSATWSAGQHFFLRFGGLGVHTLTSHPFTVSSLPSADGKSVARFVIRGRGGVTARLASRAKSGHCEVCVWLDGPYGALGFNLKTARFDHALLVAGGAGAAFCLPLLEAIVRSRADHAATGSWSSIRLIWATRDASAWTTVR